MIGPPSSSGTIWRSVSLARFDPPRTPFDNNSATVEIVASRAGNNAARYQRHGDGSIWRYTGTPCSNGRCAGWEQLDNNTRTISIVAGTRLYQLHDGGGIWVYTGPACSGGTCPGWQRDGITSRRSWLC